MTKQLKHDMVGRRATAVNSFRIENRMKINERWSLMNEMTNIIGFDIEKVKSENAYNDRATSLVQLSSKIY